MKHLIVFATLAMTMMALSAVGAVVSDSQLTTGTFATGDDSLNVKISSTDLIQGQTGALLAGGFHGATPGTNTDRLITLTDGVFSANSLNVIAADTDGSSTPSCIIEYTLTPPSDVWEIVAFSGHDSAGDRAFINIEVEIDSGSGYVPLGVNLKTGEFGTPKPGFDAVAYARVYDDSVAPLATGVEKIRLTVQNVSHNSIGFFQAFDDNTTAPPSAYPNQGTILKEIDVKVAPSSVAHWMQY